MDPEEELDDLDEESTQIIGLDESGVIATCRLRDPAAGECKLERMAVDEAAAQARGRRRSCWPVPSDEGRAQARAEMVAERSAPSRAVLRRERIRRRGRTFLEAGIEHVRMRKALGGGPEAEARDPPRPAHRPADDPLAGPRRPALRLPRGRDRARSEGGRELPLLRGARGPHAARDLGGSPGRRRPGHSRLAGSGGPQPLSGAGADLGGRCADRAPAPAPRPARDSRRSAIRCEPPRAGESPTSSARRSPPASTR